MRTDALRLVCDKLKNASFVGFRGKEYISRPYELELFFTLPSGGNAKDAVGQRAKIEISRDDAEPPVVIHGVIAGLRLMKPLGDRVLYRALLVPRLWMLRHFRRSNVFTFQKIKDFLSDTLKDGGLQPNEFRFAIDPGAYPEEEFVAQYRESHLDFFHRWLEREGLYYYFEHKPDADGEVLVIVDDTGGLEAFPGTGPAAGGKVRYFPTVGDDVLAREALHQIEVDTTWLPKSITIEDYDYSNPSAPLKGEGAISKTGVGVMHEYGYRVFVDKDVKRLAKVRAEAIGCRATTMKAEGDALGPRAGYKLKIDDRPEDLDEEWLAVEVEHSGSIAGWTPELGRLTGLKGSDVYRIEIFAVPASVAYRAPQTTPWPRVNGFENGTVGGPADSEYAQIDADGRYLVRFEFDQSGLGDPKISTRIRMLQPHGGETEGFHFPLRKETEVMVAFLGGDPDRPFIAGVVPNALKPSVVGERNHTQNIIRTGSNNQIVMEDEKGKEFIFMHSPNNDTGIYMGHPAGTHNSVYTGEGEEEHTWPIVDPDAVAAGSKSITTKVAISLSHYTGGAALLSVGKDYWVNVFGAKHEFVVGATRIGYFDTYKLDVGGAATEVYNKTRTTTTKTGRVDKVLAGGMTQEIKPFLYQTIKGQGFSHVEGGAWRHEVDTEAHDKYGSWKTEVKGAWNEEIKGEWHGKFAGATVKIDATSGNLAIDSSNTINMTAKNEIKIEAIKVDAGSTGFWNQWMQRKNEGMLEAVTTAVFKADETGIGQAFTGLKVETTLVSVTNKGVYSATFAGIKKAYGAAKEDGAVGVRAIAAKIWTGAFAKG